MERLTTKVENEYVCLLTKEQEQSILYHYRDRLPNPTEIDKLRMDSESLDLRLNNVNQKLGKLEDLEEEIGCPLEVFITAIMQRGIFTIYGYVDTDNVGYTSDNKFVMSVERWEYEQQLLLVSDYKKTWWLKADRSE